MSLISVIVPIYNSEKYLNRCIDSILNQSYRNLEIILIDDGSIDNSFEVCKKYSNIDNRIKIVHKKNEGVSSARNIGLNMAKGEWISFIDSDDYIEKEMYEKLYKNALKNDAEISTCVLKYRTIEDKVINPFKGKLVLDEINSSVDLMKKIYYSDFMNSLCVCMCTKLYKKYIFENLRFINGIYEDDEISTRILINNYKIAILNEPLYIYVQNLNSITNSKFSLKNLNFLNILKKRIKIFSSNEYKELKKQTFELYFNMLIEYYVKARKEKLDEYLTEYISFGIKNIINILNNKYIPLKSKIRFIIFLCNKKIYIKILDIKELV